MVTDAVTPVRKLMLPILAVQPEVAKSFLFGLTGQFTAPAETEIDGQPLVFVHFDPAGGGEAALLASLAIADGLVVLLRHLDAESLEQARRLLARAPDAAALPRIFVVVRAAVETELKLGCPACAQKLRVDTAETGRTARCPRCDFTFRIPAPEAVLRAGLPLDRSVPVTTAVLGQGASCRGAVQPLLRLIGRAAPPAAAPALLAASV